MIYEYPEQFVVPVVYIKEIRDIPMYRTCDEKDMQEDKSPLFESQLQEDIVSFNEDNRQNFGVGDIKFLNFEEEQQHQQEILNYSATEEGLNTSHANNVLKDVDNEYAQNEALNI